ncbi:methyltransferase domain-containing protein [Staphylotrichum tortipilum]|uniref:Methyltransferase domain-containing protein n=1 Tax=Staphylotrichum tortipilum TaxID=2831512 RepID=A0AAN6MCV8_9PEZI|nr:methyltransferase domain-containing protein [Staphylotrichum longicolle]
MLPTPSTTHVPYARVYEPAEDSFLLLDTFASPSETAFLSARFPSSSFTATLNSPPTTTTTITATTATTRTETPASPTPLILELGPGSGVVLAFLAAHAPALFGRPDVLTLGIDVNRFACAATRETVRRAVAEAEAADAGAGEGGAAAAPAWFLGAVRGDLAGCVRAGAVDVLVFNPPYVPTPELPAVPVAVVDGEEGAARDTTTMKPTFAEDSALLALSYAGGRDGMEVTERVMAALPAVLSARGVAYLLLCAQNRPDEVKARLRGEGWRAETVGTSGRQAGWEKLQIVRIWRD